MDEQYTECRYQYHVKHNTDRGESNEYDHLSLLL